jgi:hypothetical protein
MKQKNSTPSHEKPPQYHKKMMNTFGMGGSYSHHVFFILFDSSLFQRSKREKRWGTTWCDDGLYITQSHAQDNDFSRSGGGGGWRREAGPKTNGGSDCVVIIIDHEKSNILAGHGQDKTFNYYFSSFFLLSSFY